MRTSSLQVKVVLKRQVEMQMVEVHERILFSAAEIKLVALNKTTITFLVSITLLSVTLIGIDEIVILKEYLTI